MLRKRRSVGVVVSRLQSGGDGHVVPGELKSCTGLNAHLRRVFVGSLWWESCVVEADAWCNTFRSVWQSAALGSCE